MWENDVRFDRLLDLVSQATADFLALQAESGADALMLFDSWASAVPSHLRKKVVIDPVNRITGILRDRGIETPLIGFPKGIGEGLIEYCNETASGCGNRSRCRYALGGSDIAVASDTPGQSRPVEPDCRRRCHGTRDRRNP